MRYEDWLEEHAARWAVDHVEFGHGWGAECPMDVYSVRWSPLTGELFAVEQATREVDVLGIIPDAAGVKEVTQGWQDQERTQGGLYWLRNRAATLLPPSLRDAVADAPEQGRRHRIEQEDGRWWELGWDRPLATYYAQHYDGGTDPDDPSSLLAWKGVQFGELPDVAALEAATGLSVPHDVAVDLAVDRAWFPNAGRPSFIDAAEEWLGDEPLPPSPDAYGLDEGPIDLEDSLGRREAVLELRRRELDAREHELDRRERQLSSQQAALQTLTPGEPRWSLPAEPVVRLVHAAQRATGDDLASVAKGFGLDSQWLGAVMTGKVSEVDLPHIQQVCEGVKCSPYDLWGKDDAQAVLHAYGPELWPRLMEPLQDAFGINGMNIDPSPGIDL